MDTAKKVEVATIQGSDTPQQALILFCEYDLQNIKTPTIRVEWTSKEYQDVYVKIHGDWPMEVDTDQIIIVSTYHVAGVMIKGDSARGKVIYERLGYSKGKWSDPRIIVADYNGGEEVEYELRKIDNRWYVYNPPVVLHVSLSTLINYYRDSILTRVPQDLWIDPKFSNAQRKVVAQNYADMAKIMQISSDYLKRLQERYAGINVPEYTDSDRKDRVSVRYTGKWNVEILPESQHVR